MSKDNSSLVQTLSEIKLNRENIYDLMKETENLLDKDPEMAFLPEVRRNERIKRDVDDLIQRYKDKNNIPILFGLFIGVKDIFITDEFETKCGSNLPSILFKGKESGIVTRLRNNGAIVAGKTVTTEFAYFTQGVTRNPHDHDHTPGGSSSGSASAVARGTVFFALGTQTIGSVSRPASFCGVAGFKPTQGRLGIDGIIPFSITLDQPGYFVKTPHEIWLPAQALIDDWDNTYDLKDFSMLKAGIPSENYLKHSEPIMRDCFQKYSESLKALGVQVVETDLFSDMEEIRKAHRIIMIKDAWNYHSNFFEENRSLYSSAMKEMLLEGKAVKEIDYKNALQYRIRSVSIWKEYVKMGFDFFISPSACGPAPLYKDGTGDPIMNLPFTFLGVPTISMPFGVVGKLPLGIQIACDFNKDERLVLLSSKLFDSIKCSKIDLVSKS